jgi:hypothetical protein
MARSLGRVLAPALAAMLLAAGCGGGESDDERWANGVCSTLGDWVTEVDAAAREVTEKGLGLVEADVRAAAERVGDATEELGRGLDELEPPESDSAAEAEAELRELRESLDDQLEETRRALEAAGAPIEAVTRVAAALGAAAAGVEASLRRLGEVEDAFADAGACDELRRRASTLGS